MIRKPTYAGKVDAKDEHDILIWARHKTAEERLIESWRLHCINHGISTQKKLDRFASTAKRRL